MLPGFLPFPSRTFQCRVSYEAGLLMVQKEVGGDAGVSPSKRWHCEAISAAARVRGQGRWPRRKWRSLLSVLVCVWWHGGVVAMVAGSWWCRCCCRIRRRGISRSSLERSLHHHSVAAEHLAPASKGMRGGTGSKRRYAPCVRLICLGG